MSLILVALAGASSWAGVLGRNWATQYETIVSGGYDSNVNGVRVGEISDGYGSLYQSVTVSRVNTLTSVELVGDIEQTLFFSESDADFLDGGVELSASYPREGGDVIHWDAKTYWKDDSDVDLDEGLRIGVESYGARVGGEWFHSPKAGFRGSIHGRVADRSRDGFSTTRSLTMRTGFSHAWRPEGRWSGEYALKLSESDGGSGTDAVHHIFGLRSHGRLSSKITGDALVGVRNSSFDGLYDFSDTGPIVTADLTWVASPQFNATLGLLNDYDFSANGDVTLRTSARLRLRRDLGRGLKVELRIGGGRSSFESQLDEIERTDDYWDIGGQVEYSFTQRYFLRLAADWVDSESSEPALDVGRTVVSLRSGWRY
ncbi:outer membrane beta-barrel protein [Pelagicoccus mobilis]